MAELVNLGDCIDASVDPDKVGLIDLVDADSPREYTYAELDAAANAVARGLAARGLHPGDRVAILSANRAEYVSAYFGTMRAGMVSVPASFKFPKDTIDYILRDSGAKLVFADAQRRADCPADLPVVEFGQGGADGFDAFLDAGPFASVPTGADDVAMFLYTSGSTGRPKGVPLTHGGHGWAVTSRPIEARERGLVAAPLYHMNGLFTAKVMFHAHASIVMMEQFRARPYIEAIAKYRCTSVFTIPTMMALVAREEDLLEELDLSAVRVLTMGSAPVTMPLFEKVMAMFPGAIIGNGYGTTEAGPVVFGPHPEGIPTPPLSLGYPLASVEVRLEGGEAADEGVLHMRTQAVTPGYHNLPDETAKRLHDGWYDSGDVMRRDADGFYYFVGRGDDMFVCGGENIYPGEVEMMLERQPGVLQAAVVPLADDIKGQRPVAFIVRRQGSSVTEEEIKAFALDNGPAYQHPRHVGFLDALPLAGTNKINVRKLTEMAKAAWGSTEE